MLCNGERKILEITSIMEIWKWFKWLPQFILRKVFNKKRLSDLVYIDIRPRNEPFRIQLSNVSSYDVYFQIINMSPFEIELDRAEIKFNLAGVSVNHQHIKKFKLKSGYIGDLLVSGNIDFSSANIIANLSASNGCQLSMYAVFKCNLHEFEKDNIYLSGINPTYVGSLLLAQENK